LGSAKSIIPTAAATLTAFAVHLILYYSIFRTRIPSANLRLGEGIRIKMGFWARILQGGIVEEVQFRWGLMALIAAPGLLILGADSSVAIALAILLSAFLFAAFHLVGARQLGLGREAAERNLIIVDNMLIGVVFGWLFWRYGLVSAMICHGLLHAAWHPLERRLWSTG
jgi:membrane protease YdiL (CAAX protease family)